MKLFGFYIHRINYKTEYLNGRRESLRFYSAMKSALLALSLPFSIYNRRNLFYWGNNAVMIDEPMKRYLQEIISILDKGLSNAGTQDTKSRSRASSDTACEKPVIDGDT